MNRLERQLQPILEKYQHNPFRLCEMAGFKPSWQQNGLLVAGWEATYNRAPRRIVVKSGQGPGKTSATIFLALWRLLRRYNSRVIITAPTMRQCRNWITELQLWLEKMPPEIRGILTVTKSRVIVAGIDTWSLELVTATKPQNAQGLHRPGMSIFMDEFSGIPRPLVEQFEGTLSNEDPLLIGTGNPNTRDCAMFDCFNRFRALWRTMTWNAEESPHVSAENLEYLIAKYGRNSDVYRIRVLGEFPHADPNCVMSSEDLEKCVKLDIYKLMTVNRLLGGVMSPAQQIANDFARYGGDENVCYRRQGNAIIEQSIEPHADPGDMVDVAFKMQKDARWRDNECWHVPDATGMGEGVIHRYYRAGKQVHEFKSARRAMDPMFEDMITEAWFDLGALVKQHAFYLPDDNMLLQQLATRRYYTTKQGKIELESKDEYLKRGFEDSPDRADCAVQVAYNKLMATVISSAGATSVRVGQGVRS